MRITRTGSERNRGTKTIIPALSIKTGEKDSWRNNVHWDSHSKEIGVFAPFVTHTDGRTHHNYRIRLTLEDISSLIEVIGHAGSASDAQLLRDHLRKHVPAIVKLLACATDLVPTEMNAEEDEEE